MRWISIKDRQILLSMHSNKMTKTTSRYNHNKIKRSNQQNNTIIK
jgi:hypothetical protein